MNAVERLWQKLWLRLIFALVRRAALKGPHARKLLIWTPTPLINNKFWSGAMRGAGYESQTVVTHHYPAHKRTDYDLYYDEILEQSRWGKWAGKVPYLVDFLAFLYVIRNAKVVHIPFTGGPLGATPFWRSEAPLYKKAGIKIVVIPYGGDAHMYSKILNTSMRNALLIDYPMAARRESEIAERVEYWSRQADCVMCGALIYGMSRWDVTTASPLCLDLEKVRAKSSYSDADGRNGPVRVVHAPNHRGFKGTEYVIRAVEELRQEGLQVDLVLLERVLNDVVMDELGRADILVEQLIAGMYALNAIEGMASGVAVMSNLDDLPRSQLFRRYSFLDECPVLSTTPENVKANLRRLVTDPALRAELGRASRKYAEKYHSYETAQYLFGSIYAKLLEGKEVDLMNLFHPLKSAYNQSRPKIDHPLVQGHLN